MANYHITIDKQYDRHTGWLLRKDGKIEVDCQFGVGIGLPPSEPTVQALKDLPEGIPYIMTISGITAEQARRYIAAIVAQGDA